MRIAIVHHWFTSISGGERVVDALGLLYPNADVFTLFCEPTGLPPSVRDRKVTASFLNRMPGARRFHRHFLPMFPLAVESLDLSGYDLVISSDSGPVKGVITDPASVHICYCHSPMRYLWDSHADYSQAMGVVAKLAFKLSSHYVRNWDYAAAQRVDYFVANSAYVAARIRKYYRRESTVIYPPVETHRGRLALKHGDYYLSVGRLVRYKRTDLLIEACNRLGRKLLVVGSGPELPSLRRMAGPTITFLGALDDAELWDVYSKCRALLFAANEDFGLVPLEAQACGRPVIAYHKGGVLETVVGPPPAALPKGCADRDELQTGVFFGEQTPEALVEAILEYEPIEDSFNPRKIREYACRFDTSFFLSNFANYVDRILRLHRTSAAYGEDLLADISVPVQNKDF
jgi:glycosyltransferase involved in cell wall biosynthesis